MRSAAGAAIRSARSRAALSPYIRLSADGVSGEFLLDYGATRSSLSAAAFAGSEGSTRNAALSLAGVPAAPFVLRAYDMPLAPSGGQLGVIGTDILSRLAVQLSKRVAFIGAAPCQPDALRAKGLVPISQSGFFGADPTLNDGHHPNVPVVFVSVGGVRAPAQIDTGYDDVVYTHSVDINQPLFDRLIESGVALDRCRRHQCRNLPRPREPKRLQGRKSPACDRNRQGRANRPDNSFHLILKRANGCGGIAAMTTPAAQLGASFFEFSEPLCSIRPIDRYGWRPGEGPIAALRGVSREGVFHVKHLFDRFRPVNRTS